MKLRESVFLLPGYELDGYPRSLTAALASDLLSGWLGLWHPRLLAATQSAPRWQQTDPLPSELSGMLLVAPAISADQLESQAEAKIAEAGGLLLRPNGSWREFQQQLMASATKTGLLDAPEVETPLVAELQGDFAALGYAFLQIQLMTRQLRYTSNLDLTQFGLQLSEAAQASLDGDHDAAERMLQACFDSLGQERDHYYSLDVNLIDVTLLAPTTLGHSLAAQLEGGQVTTFMASGSLLRQLKEKHPDTHQRLLGALADRRVTVAGGLDVERPHPLMTRDSIARDFARGRKSYADLQVALPRVFGRMSFGLNPDFPGLLRRFGFSGCFLTAWSGGSYPEGSQAKISWEAADGTFLPTLAVSVLDSANPSSFLSLGWAIGEALDHQHVPTVVLAHWPNQSCEFAELLRAIARRTPALGKWMLADDYFDETDQPYHQERLTASGFRFNWLLETESASQLLHATKSFHLLQARCRSLQNLSNMAWQLEHYHRLASRAPDQNPAREPSDEGPASEADEILPLPITEWAPELTQLIAQSDSLLDEPRRFAEIDSEAHVLADRVAEQVLQRLAKQLDKSKPKNEAASGVGRLLMNPRSCPLRFPSHTSPKQHFSSKADWHFADGRVGDERVTCVDIPSMGFVYAPLHDQANASAAKERPLADAGGLLNNEFLEVQIDSGRGNLRSLHIPARRGNRLSLMIARRDVDQAGKYVYSNMVASHTRMLTSSNVCGLIRASGHLEFNNEAVANFEIDYRLWRGSRVVDIDVKLDELAPLADSNPWRSAYIARLAWPTESAILRTFACGNRQQWSGGRALAPSLIEIDETDYRTHYLTGGLAFHRRVEERFLETILAVQDDERVHHRLAVGVDLPHPLLASTQFLDRPYELELLASHAPAAAASGWLASVDTKNVIVELECPLVNARGELLGVRLFLTETDGKSTNAHVRLLRELESASRVDYIGGTIGKLTAEGDRITIAMRAGEQVNVDVLWKK
jgi:alpha-mannosidase